jgi:hypothetical protein
VARKYAFNPPKVHFRLIFYGQNYPPIISHIATNCHCTGWFCFLDPLPKRSPPMRQWRCRRHPPNPFPAPSSQRYELEMRTGREGGLRYAKTRTEGTFLWHVGLKKKEPEQNSACRSSIRERSGQSCWTSPARRR